MDESRAPKPPIENKQELPEQEKLQPANPLDLSQEPLSRYQIFDVRYQGEQDFLIVTAQHLPDMVYLYDGDVQIARVKLSPDKKNIAEFTLAKNVQNVSRILDQNPNFPFREQLKQMVSPKQQEALPTMSFEFNPSPEVVAEAEKLFKSIFNSDRFFSVSPELLAHLLKSSSAPTDGLHLPQVIDGKPNLMLETFFNRALGWLLANNYDVDDATNLARRMVYGDTLLLNSKIDGDNIELERNRLAFHESLHIFVSSARQSDNKGLREIAEKMMDSYSEIPSQQRIRAEVVLARLGYNPKQRPEEFWTYYLADRAYPPEDGHTPMEELVKLGKHTNIETITNNLSFLTNTDEIHALVNNAIASAQEIKSKGKIT